MTTVDIIIVPECKDNSFQRKELFVSPVRCQLPPQHQYNDEKESHSSDILTWNYLHNLVSSKLYFPYTTNSSTTSLSSSSCSVPTRKYRLFLQYSSRRGLKTWATPLSEKNFVGILTEKLHKCEVNNEMIPQVKLLIESDQFYFIPCEIISIKNIAETAKGKKKASRSLDPLDKVILRHVNDIYQTSNNKSPAKKRKGRKRKKYVETDEMEEERKATIDNDLFPHHFCYLSLLKEHITEEASFRRYLCDFINSFLFHLDDLNPIKSYQTVSHDGLVITLDGLEAEGNITVPHLLSSTQIIDIVLLMTTTMNMNYKKKRKGFLSSASSFQVQAAVHLSTAKSYDKKGSVSSTLTSQKVSLTDSNSNRRFDNSSNDKYNEDEEKEEDKEEEENETTCEEKEAAGIKSCAVCFDNLPRSSLCHPIGCSTDYEDHLFCYSCLTRSILFQVKGSNDTMANQIPTCPLAKKSTKQSSSLLSQYDTDGCGCELRQEEVIEILSLYYYHSCIKRNASFFSLLFGFKEQPLFRSQKEYDEVMDRIQSLYLVRLSSLLFW
jgi:hypothetical protein